MLTISKPLAPAQAIEYYENEYADPGQSLGTDGVAAEGVWAGRLAESWGLQGAVTDEQFARLCDGLHPLTEARMVRHASPRTYMNFYGERVTSMARRAGYDATFSAPKSVSLVALVGSDARVAVAHREAVSQALIVLEEHVQARMGGNRPAQDTGQLIAARFEHALARPDRASGYAAPQLHTHCLIFNVTVTDGGEMRPIQPLELHRTQRLATAVYRSALGWRLVELGYEVERDPRTNAPEVKGLTREYLEANSPRRAEVLRRAEEVAARLEHMGAAGVRRGAGLLHAAAHADRAAKCFDPARVRERHLELEARFGHQAQRTVESALARGLVVRDEQDAARRALWAVTAVRDEALMCGARVDSRRLLADALRLSLCETTYGAVRMKFEARLESGDLRDVLHAGSPALRERSSAPLGAQTDMARKEARASRSKSVPSSPSVRRTAVEISAMLAEMFARGRVLEVADVDERLRAVVAASRESHEATLVISTSGKERERLNELIRRELGAGAADDAQGRTFGVYAPRGAMDGHARSRADAYIPGENFIRYGRSSRVYGLSAGEYGRVIAADITANTITVVLGGGREVTYNPARLSGAGVYRHVERLFARGDRVQFGVPIRSPRVSRGETGTVTKIDGDTLGLTTDRGHAVTLDAGDIQHLDYGYAVAEASSHSADSRRLIVSLVTEDNHASPAQRKALAALLCREDVALFFTDSIQGLRETFGMEAPERSTSAHVHLTTQLPGETAAALAHPVSPEIASGNDAASAVRANRGIEITF
ncbi:MAG: hypothetical protein QOH51_935 [Acidobacteriota bacterium]|nr:hypothetical protein [Acidobacteriota bacterium]